PSARPDTAGSRPARTAVSRSTACQSAGSLHCPRCSPDIATYRTLPHLWFAVLVAVHVHANTRRVPNIPDLDATVKFLHLIVFQQRIAFPVVRAQDAPMVRMIGKVHAKHVIGFPLMPLGGTPDITHRWHHPILAWGLDFERNFMAPGGRVQVVDHTKCLIGSIVDTAQTHQRVA